MNFNQLGDHTMLPILEKMSPPEREKLLLLLRSLSHPRAYPWIDEQLARLARGKKRGQLFSGSGGQCGV